jgi:predicted nucleic acid-binding protein
MDLMLSLDDYDVHEIAWSEHLLAEWERVVIREGARTPAAAAKLVAAIREAFAERCIPEAAYAHLVADMPSADPDDRFHIAAAIAGGVDVIVTWNLRDFPAVPLAKQGVTVQTPDDYLCGLLDSDPDLVMETLTFMAQSKRRPPMTRADLLERLAGAGARGFAAAAARRLR